MRDDILSALRALKSSPLPALAAVLTLAIAIGTNVGMVSLVGRALLSPPTGVKDPSALVGVAFERGEGSERARMMSTSYVTYRAIRDNVPAFASVAAWQRSSTGATIDGEQVSADAMSVSGSYFATLGATPLVGRAILEADDRIGADAVAVVSHAFWKSAFGGAPALGWHLAVNGLDYVVIGIMPARFSGHSAANVDIWVPFTAAMRRTPGWDQDPYRRVASILARLAPGAAAQVAAAQASAGTSTRVVLEPLAGADVPAVDRRVALWLTGVSILVFAIGLANAGTLLLVRAERRRRDFAVRAALGASRARLVRQALIEASLVSAAAAVAAVLLAAWFEQLVRTVLLPGLAPEEGISRLTIVGAAGSALVAAVTTGLATISAIPRGALAPRLEGGDREGSRRGRTGTTLLVVQAALSVILLAGAGLFGRSLYNLVGQDLGLTMDRAVVVDVEAGPGTNTGHLFDAAVERVRAVPGVHAVAPIAAIPFSGFNVPPIAVPGLAAAPSVNGQLPFLQAATPAFFDILGVRIVEGRRFTDADERGAPVVIVNETMARAVWPNQSAIGKCIRIGFDPDFDPETAAGPPVPSAAVPCREVIGVAHDMRQRSLIPGGGEDRLMQYFVPFSQVPVPPFVPQAEHGAWGLLLQVDALLASVAPAIRRAVTDGRVDVPFIRVRPYAQLLERQTRPWHLGTVLLALFSGLALVVGAVGLYAAFAHSVILRRREMAIRLALGSRPRNVLALVLREALGLAAAGTVLGWVVVAIGGRWLQSLLYDTSRVDPVVLAAAGAIMLMVAVAATLLPARSAARSDPAALLRL